MHPAHDQTYSSSRKEISDSGPRATRTSHEQPQQNNPPGSSVVDFLPEGAVDDLLKWKLADGS
jgi:hypothetical protein